MNKIIATRESLRACLLLAGKNDPRERLNGLYIEANTNETRITGTNGAVLGTYAQRGEGINKVEGIVSVIVPRETIATLKKGGDIQVEFIQDDNGDWVMESHGVTVSFTPIDDTFPDYRQVIPRECSGDAAQYNPYLVELFAKAEKELGKGGGKGSSGVHIAHNGMDAAGVTLGIDDHFAGVIMPMRIGDRPSVSWAKAELTP